MTPPSVGGRGAGGASLAVTHAALKFEPLSSRAEKFLKCENGPLVVCVCRFVGESLEFVTARGLWTATVIIKVI